MSEKKIAFYNLSKTFLNPIRIQKTTTRNNSFKAKFQKNAQTISITVKDVTVVITDYELTNNDQESSFFTYNHTNNAHNTNHSLNEGNAFKFDSENADEIVEGWRT